MLFTKHTLIRCSHPAARARPGVGAAWEGFGEERSTGAATRPAGAPDLQLGSGEREADQWGEWFPVADAGRRSLESERDGRVGNAGYEESGPAPWVRRRADTNGETRYPSITTPISVDLQVNFLCGMPRRAARVVLELSPSPA